MMRAAGYTDTKTFFKAVEDGKIMANDVLPKFGQELQKLAKEGGALDAVMGKTQANFSRFLNAVTEAKLAIFGGGMDEGLGYLFDKLSSVLVDLQPILKVIGGLFKGFATTLAAVTRVLITPLAIIGDFLEAMKLTNPNVMAVVGTGGTLLLLAMRFKLLTKWAFGFNIQLLAILRNIARFAILPLIVEDVYGMFKGRDSVTGRMLDTVGAQMGNPNMSGDAANWYSKGGLSRLWDRAVDVSSRGVMGTMMNQSLDVVLRLDGEETKKMVKAQIEDSSQRTKGVTQTENTQ